MHVDKKNIIHDRLARYGPLYHPKRETSEYITLYTEH